MNIFQIEGKTDATSVRVAVYRKLGSGATWSIKALEGPDRDRVIAYAEEVTLTDVEFVVKREQHRKIIAGESKRGRKRNVLAWMTGKIADGENVLANPVRVDFNFYPEHTPEGQPVGEFFRFDTNEIMHGADVVRFTSEGNSGRAFIA